LILGLITLFISIMGNNAVSLLPPVIAIGLAFVTKQVLISLFCGVWCGAVISLIRDNVSPAGAVVSGFFRVADNYAVKGMTDESHIMIILFSLMIGGMIGIITASGGMHGIVNQFSKKTDTGVKAQILAWASGLIIFFDDYANTLIVGNSIRPLTDKYKVSREKLSFIIDSTTAPVASVAILSTWIGYEIGLIGDALKATGVDLDPYSVFIYSLPYRFYALLLLGFIPVYILLKRDFGPMLKAEKRSQKSSGVEENYSDNTDFSVFKIPPENKCKWYTAAIPVIVLIIMTFGGVFLSGYLSFEGENWSLREIIGASDPFKVLIWGSLSASVVAGIAMILSGTGNLTEVVSAWIEGVKSMVTAMIILVLAWALSSVVIELKTAEYILFLLSDTLPYRILPGLVFLTASVTSFATGTSWGTMALLFPTTIPLAIPLALAGGVQAGEIHSYIYCVTGAILTGAIFGDHCSPISDTTIMASMSCRVSHIEHVRTQMPYAIVIGAISFFIGYLPAGFMINPFILLIPQFAGTYLIFRYIGKKVEQEHEISES
ncbi:MAG TPA: Na+/H+ antiporter NhaC family protein, partial [bacterium]|nr:Na+/H+ antiporter NhaC family protein [bacterium]